MALKDVGVKLVVEGSAQFKSAMTGAERSVKGVGGAINKAAPAMRKLGVGMVAAVGAIGGASLKMAADFESGMREVSSLINLSEDQFQTLSGQVLDLSKDLGVDAVGATKALYQAISAGIPAENALRFLEVASKAAIGGVTDTETAVDGITTVMNAFKFEMDDTQKIADIMFATVKGGKTTFEELSSSMSIVAPIAASLGVKFEDVMGAVATLTKQGAPTAIAMTQIRSALVALTKPSKGMTDLLDKLGFASGEAALQALGFAGTMDALREAANGNNRVLVEAFGRVEGFNALLGVTGENAETAAADLEAMAMATEGAGAATEAFNEINKSTARQFAQVQAKLKAVAIEIGTALIPAITQIMEAIKPMLDKVIDWISENPKLTATILGVFGAVGLLLPLITMLPGLIAAIGPVITALTGPIGLVIIAIVAWGLAIKAFADNWEVIWRGVQRVFATIVNGIIEGINAVIRTINLIPGVNIAEIGRVGPAPAQREVSERTRRIQEERASEVAALTARLTPQTVSNETTINVEANYTSPEEPQSIEMDLEGLRMLTES